MKSLFHQTKQAFYFSLAFYLLGLALLVLHVSFAPVVISIALLLSLIWVILALREIMLSARIDSGERILMVLLIIFFNVIGGIAYFFVLRERVIGKQNIKK